MMPPTPQRARADRLLARQLSGSIVMPLAEDIWLHIMKMVRAFKIYYPAWLRAKYHAIWEFRHMERVLFGTRLPSPEPQFYGPGMGIGEYSRRDPRDGRPQIRRALMS